MKTSLAICLLLSLPLLFAPKALALRCSDFQYWEDAQGYPSLDRDGDGSACESLPRRGSTSPSRPSQSSPATPPASRPNRPALQPVSDVVGTIISQGGDTAIYDIATSLPRGSYRYSTESHGEAYQGTIQLTSRAIDQDGTVTATGSFTDSSRGGNGCLGRLKLIYLPEGDQFTSIWYVDGTATGTCQGVGNTFELREMYLVQ